MSDSVPRVEFVKLKERCGVDGCRSRRYFKDAGKFQCDRGHEHPELETDATGGDSERLQGQIRSRVKRKRPEKISQIQRGTPALLLYLQSYQIILQKQCQALIHTVGLSSELEQVVKDLWTLRLQHMRDQLGETDNQIDVVFDSQQSDDEDQQDDIPSAAKWRTKSTPTLIESLALCYLATMILRLPLSIGEIHHSALVEAVPFVRAVRLVPYVLRKRMPAELQAALDTITPLGPDHLRKAIHQLGLFYQHHFSLNIPPLNFPPLLCRHIKNMALPLQTYGATVGLAQMLGIEFIFPRPRGRQRLSSLPELTLISLIAIAVKLYYPFDSRPRSVARADDPARSAIDWDVWTKSSEKHRQRQEDDDHLKRGREMYVTEEDALRFTDNQMDDYLDWYERTWVDETRAQEAPRGASKYLLELFPIRSNLSRDSYDYQVEAAREHDSKLIEVQETMRNAQKRQVAGNSPEADAGEKAPPVGALYKRYRDVDNLTQHARVFHEALAQAAAISLGTLLKVVLQVEGRVLAWRKRQVSQGNQNDDVGEEEAGTSSEVAIGEMNEDQEL